MKAKEVVAVILTSVLLAAVAATPAGAEADASGSPRSAPGFTLPSVGQVSLDDVLAKKAVVLWFTNLCGGCRANMMPLDELRETFGDSLEIVAVSVLGEDEGTVRDAVAKLGVGFPFLIDADGKVTELYAGGYVPNSCPINNIFFIDREGTILETSHYPGLPRDDLEGLVRRLLREGE
jgi:cytochrome c biogenesis protein CcmG/thiol:disulfide interchange protein DsbE